ncbi:hypothetical protein [Comamonas sp.]|nr:hypothetical protein [Comamonas sp.]
MSTTTPPVPEQQPEPIKRCIHCLALIHTEPKEGEALPCCGN